eukprot:gene21265-26276_t
MAAVPAAAGRQTHDLTNDHDLTKVLTDGIVLLYGSPTAGVGLQGLRAMAADMALQ